MPYIIPNGIKLRFKNITKIETKTKTISMPTHMEKYIDEVLMIGSGPSILARLAYLTSLRKESFIAYQELSPDSNFQRRLKKMEPNDFIVYNTISGTNTAFTKKDDNIPK